VRTAAEQRSRINDTRIFILVAQVHIQDQRQFDDTRALCTFFERSIENRCGWRPPTATGRGGLATTMSQYQLSSTSLLQIDRVAVRRRYSNHPLLEAAASADPGRSRRSPQRHTSL
jgi:hypothetical protein